MNTDLPLWKFWLWPQLARENLRLVKRLETAETNYLLYLKRTFVAEEEWTKLAARVEKFSERPVPPANAAEQARAELQRDLALAGVQEDHPLWQAVLGLVDEHAGRETDAALSPKLNNDERQYTAGAAASANYLAQMLRDARQLAEQRMAKQRQSK